MVSGEKQQGFQRFCTAPPFLSGLFCPKEKRCAVLNTTASAAAIAAATEEPFHKRIWKGQGEGCR